MHGESTQAPSGEQAGWPGSEQRPGDEGVWCLDEAVVCSERTKERTKGSLLGGP